MSVDWLGVEPRHLTALLAIRREGSFRGAARHLGLGQSVVSQRIVQVERVVGSTLVRLGPGQATVRLTDAGRVLAEHAEGIVAAGRRPLPPALKRLVGESCASSCTKMRTGDGSSRSWATLVGHRRRWKYSPAETHKRRA